MYLASAQSTRFLWWGSLIAFEAHGRSRQLSPSMVLDLGQPTIRSTFVQLIQQDAGKSVMGTSLLVNHDSSFGILFLQSEGNRQR